MTPLLSLVTGTVNRPNGFHRLLQSVIDRTSVPWEMIVGDGSDVPGAYTSDLPPSVTVLYEKPRLGYVRGYNAAFQKTSGEWVIFLNDDAEACEGYAENAIQFMEAHPKIGLGALHYSENGQPFHANGAYGCLYANFGILRRSLGEHIHWFDPEFEMYGSDNALTFQVLLAGYGVADIPNARILHHSVNDAMRQANQGNRYRDNRILTKKYMPLEQHWKSTYHRHRVDSGIPIWMHGIPPERVRA